MVLALTRSQEAARLGIGAAVALAAWLVLLGLLAVATRARRPDAAPASMEMGGEEPPAVVSMLTSGWKVGREAVPATLIDLAARKVVSIEAVGPDRFMVRLPASARSAAGPPGLTPYEDQVLGHVRRLAAPDGTLACEALTTGPEEQSKNWWKTFETVVRKDARDRGLSRGRWSGWMKVVLAVTALAPSVLAALALVVLPSQNGSGSRSDDNPVGAALGITAMVEFALLAIPGKLRAERDTPAGRAAAARWLGLRKYLSEDGTFSDAPPAAVAVWDRYLSYGAAMGVAAAAVRALPLGSESDKVAWSHQGGRWRMVRIDYPKRIPPGWGKHPALASAIGLASLAAGLFVARIFFPAMLDEASRLLDTTRDQGVHALDLLGVALLAIPTVVTAVWLIRAAAMLVAAVPDLFARREVDGVVLRIRPHEKQPYLAVDDGTCTEIRAWLVEPAVLYGAGLSQGDAVRATISPRLGHVYALAGIPADGAHP
ncbi:MAG: DUF2207 domain-containing protein [Actinomycetota bacterium]|nr:DUF2207 domain-containing protein [Actinomycetota bacterium]